MKHSAISAAFLLLGAALAGACGGSAQTGEADLTQSNTSRAGDLVVGMADAGKLLTLRAGGRLILRLPVLSNTAWLRLEGPDWGTATVKVGVGTKDYVWATAAGTPFAGKHTFRFLRVVDTRPSSSGASGTNSSTSASSGGSGTASSTSSSGAVQPSDTTNSDLDLSFTLEVTP